MTSKLSRLAVAATCAAGISGLVAGPAAAANNYVTQPVVTGVTSLTPESAVLSAAIDTGGDPAVTFNASPGTPYSFGGLTITAPSILNGIPINLGFYSTALFEADPLSDYLAAGNQGGPETVTAQTVEVPTTTGLSAVTAQVGGYPAATASGTALKPGTKYVYWVVEQVGETDQATTVNEFSASDLANWVAGSGTISAQGFSSSSKVTSSNDFAAWAAGTGSYAGDAADPARLPASVVNPDYACVLNTTIAANTNPNWASEVAATTDPISAGTVSINGTALPFGISSVNSLGVFTPTSAQQPAEQGPCVTFYGGNSTNFYTSAAGTFTTPPLGKVVFGSKATVAGKTAKLSVDDKSVEPAAGTVTLTVKKGRKTTTVASGKFRVGAGVTGSVKLKLTGAGKSDLANVSSLTTRVTFASTTDQPTSSRKVKLVK